MFNYPNLLAGAKGLLGDCVNIQSQMEFDYVVVGGWSPLLLNSNPIQHPGTHDINLLFKDASDENKLEEIFHMYLSNGDTPSAKHNFQLLKVLKSTLMSLCNALEEKLTKKEATAEKLVGAVVNAVANKTNKPKDDKATVIKELIDKHHKALEKLS